ncbi:hypothetical protein KAU11_07735 [Candidatus Babeliales bacterium]|nr:hypothetical protein [Candidatus Babeliales bacterium]
MQVVYADIHRGARYEMPLEYERGAIYLGDIYDLTGCKKKRVKYYLKQRAKLKAFAGDLYLDGNHEGDPTTIDDKVVIGKVLYRHLDEECYGRKKTVKFRSKKLGKGFIGRTMSQSFDSVRMLKPFHLSKAAKERMVDSCLDNNCHTIVGGHKHPHRLQDFLYTSTRRGVTIRIIVLPRGRTELPNLEASASYAH